MRCLPPSRSSGMVVSGVPGLLPLGGSSDPSLPHSRAAISAGRRESRSESSAGGGLRARDSASERSGRGAWGRPAEEEPPGIPPPLGAGVRRWAVPARGRARKPPAQEREETRAPCCCGCEGLGLPARPARRPPGLRLRPAAQRQLFLPRAENLHCGCIRGARGWGGLMRSRGGDRGCLSSSSSSPSSSSLLLLPEKQPSGCSSIYSNSQHLHRQAPSGFRP